jgi:hypothetical protein
VSAVPAERRLPTIEVRKSSPKPTDPKLIESSLPDPETVEAAAGSRWPRSFAALQVRNYRIYFCSQLVANTGLWM